MGSRTDKAVNNHKNFNSCSASVLMAYADKLGISESEAKTIAAPFAGGRMGKCGAVLAAEYVLEQLYGADSTKMIEEYESKYISADKGSVMCSDLRGKVPGLCRACVTDAARILEETLG